MDIRRFRIFQTVAEEKSFTRAAQKLFMTQPAVSKAIQELELELHLALFERFPKKTILTPEGEQFLDQVQQLLQLYDTMKQKTAILQESSVLRIGSSITIANEQLCPLLQQLQSKYPLLQIRLSIASTSAILEQLQQHAIDIAFLEGVIQNDQLIVQKISSYELKAVCSPAFYKEHAVNSLQDMANLPLLLREKGSAIRETFDSVMLLHDLYVDAAWTSTNSTVLMKGAQEGFGIAILPEHMVRKKLSQQLLCEIKLPQLQLINVNHIVYKKHKHLNAPMQELLKLAENNDIS
ncbi:LysR family transcriptional regulator [[Clostridium] innocuum]|nr:LysR family transcriptional regulator [[Clostridium] innocuum]